MDMEVSRGADKLVQHNEPEVLDAETVGVKKDAQPAQKSGIGGLSESGLVTSSRTDSIRPLVGGSVGPEVQEIGAGNLDMAKPKNFFSDAGKWFNKACRDVRDWFLGKKLD